MLLKNAIEEFIDHLKKKHYSKETVSGYEIDFRMLQRYIEGDGKSGVTIEAFGKAEIRGYIDYMEDRYKYTTTKRRIMSLRSMYGYFWERERINENPFLSMRIKLRYDKQERPVMNLAEIHKVLFAAYQDTKTANEIHLRDVAILEILFSTGLRVSELAHLTFENYEETDHSFTYFGKGNYKRTAYLKNKEAFGALQRYVVVCGRDTGPIFMNQCQRPLSTQAIRNLVKKYAQKAGMSKRITPHTFRRTLATLLINDDVSLPYVQGILGHKDISTTAIYVQISEEAKQIAIQKHNPRDYMSLN